MPENNSLLFITEGQTPCQQFLSSLLMTHPAEGEKLTSLPLEW